MPLKQIPTIGDSNWGSPLNAHLSQLQNPSNGGINTFEQFSGRPTNLTADDAGKTYLYTQTGNLHQWTGTTWKVLNESVINVKDYGAVGDGVVDDSVAVQVAILTGNNIYFPTAIYKISSRLNCTKDNLVIDLGGSVISWVGEKFGLLNKANRGYMGVFCVNIPGPAPKIIQNFTISNGTINANGAGSGLFLKQSNQIHISNLTINDAQCAGIDISDCTNGIIQNVNCNDCAADPTSGFGIATDLENFSDGIIIWYGSQNWLVTSCKIKNTKYVTGRCGIVVEGTSAESSRTTGNIEVTNCSVEGYDRQFHAELCDTIKVSNCYFYLEKAKVKTIGCAVITWDTTGIVVFENCKIITQSAILLYTGAKNTIFRSCELIKIGDDSVSGFVKNSYGTIGNLTFESCKIDTANSDCNFYKMNSFCDNCTFTSNNISNNFILEISNSIIVCLTSFH